MCVLVHIQANFCRLADWLARPYLPLYMSKCIFLLEMEWDQTRQAWTHTDFTVWLQIDCNQHTVIQVILYDPALNTRKVGDIVIHYLYAYKLIGPHQV